MISGASHLEFPAVDEASVGLELVLMRAKP